MKYSIIQIDLTPRKFAVLPADEVKEEEKWIADYDDLDVAVQTANRWNDNAEEVFNRNTNKP